MHYLHTKILANLEHERVARETEEYFAGLRSVGIEPGTSRKSLLSWLRTDRHTRSPQHRPRPVG